MEKKATFQHLQNPNIFLIVVIFSRQLASVPVFLDWDTVATISVVSGDNSLDGTSVRVAGDENAGYDEAVKYILKKHPEYLEIPD